MCKTRSIRLTEEAIGKLYVMAGEYQTIKEGFVSPSQAIQYLHEQMQILKKQNGFYPKPTKW